MRLIDANALSKKYMIKGKDRLRLATVINELELQPTIDPEVLRPQWIPVAERLPDNASHPGALCTRCTVMTKYGVTEGWYNPDRESWFVLFWYMTARFHERDIDFVRGDIPRLVKVPLHNGIINAWMPLPEPYKPDGENM